MPTALSIITRSLRKIGVLAEGETAAAADAVDALAELNTMLGSWSIDGLTVYRVAEVSKVLTVGDGTYTIGTGGDINTSRTTRIVDARISDGTTEWPLEIIDRDGWYRIANKTIQGIPDRLYYDPATPLGTINLYYAPGSAYTLYLGVLTPFAEIADLTDSLAYPPGYDEAIINGLAVRRASDYGIEPSNSVVQLATSSLARLKRINSRAPQLDTSEVSGMSHGSGGYDIYTDQYRA